MGNNKFKLSDMIPNSWLHKLKHMTKPKPKPKNPSKKVLLTPIFSTTAAPTKPQPITRIRKPEPTRLAAEPPRRSWNKRRSTSSSSSSRRRKPVFKPRSRFVSSSSTSTSSSSEPSLFPSDNDDPFLLGGLSSDCTCRLSSSTADIIIDLTTNRAHTKPSRRDNDDVVLDPITDLPPILTKPINFDDTVFRATRRPHRTTPRGIRLRPAKAKTSSPRLQQQAIHARRSASRYLAESLAVVKSSVDPVSDFRESMVEMIIENNIRASRDLEDLLACYLTLNSNDYHDVIVKAFEQIWLHMPDIRPLYS